MTIPTRSAFAAADMVDVGARCTPSRGDTQAGAGHHRERHLDGADAGSMHRLHEARTLSCTVEVVRESQKGDRTDDLARLKWVA